MPEAGEELVALGQPAPLAPGFPKREELKARYATAGDLVMDLRRFLEHQPIQARRPSLLGRAAKWSCGRATS